METMEKPKKLFQDLSPEEQKDLLKRRASFKELYDTFANDNHVTASADLQEMEFLLDKMFQAKRSTLTVKDIRTASDKDINGQEIFLEEGKKKGTYLLDILSDYSIDQALEWIRGLQTAIDTHKYLKTKDLTVKDLDILIKGAPKDDEKV